MKKRISGSLLGGLLPFHKRTSGLSKKGKAAEARLRETLAEYRKPSVEPQAAQVHNTPWAAAGQSGSKQAMANPSVGFRPHPQTPRSDSAAGSARPTRSAWTPPPTGTGVARGATHGAMTLGGPLGVQEGEGSSFRANDSGIEIIGSPDIWSGLTDKQVSELADKLVAEALVVVEARIEQLGVSSDLQEGEGSSSAHDPRADSTGLGGLGDVAPEQEIHQLLGPRFIAHGEKRIAHFNFVLDKLEHLVSGLPMGPERAHSEGMLGEIKESLEHMNFIIEGKPYGESREPVPDAFLQSREFLTVSARVANMISELALAHPEKVLHSIDVYEHIRPVLDGMMHSVAQMLLNAVPSLPQAALGGGDVLLHALANAGKGMRSNLQLADAEADLQTKVLLPLTAALLGVGQAKLDGAGPNFRRGLAKAMGKHVAEALKLDQDGPAASERLATRIEEALGGIVTATPVGRRDLSVELKPDAMGKFSTEDFVKALDDTLGWVEKKSRMNVVRLATEMVLKASEEIDLEGPAAKGEARNRKHAALKPQLAARLEELRMKAGAEPGLTPVQRATDVGVNVSKQLSLGLLKLSLLQSFSHEQVEQRKKAEETSDPVHPGLTKKKADLLDLTMQALMDCPDQEEMLKVMSGARVTHENLLEMDLIPARQGHTGEVLNEIEEAITKFGS